MCVCSTTSVDYLEGDLGQTEFTPAGCLSLSTVKEPLLGMFESFFMTLKTDQTPASELWRAAKLTWLL